ncbi:Bug family tripartite tricarboxylate transporter substrate binding protein [Variovorax sp. VNK109]|jgi:tripartite-type tricarboxylate transporter receptor subunit TctC|uniref:Bug family tripartite tricarboxylate transporter substrate binding protein n=1 Tax=Variovorax sp. VNK109 TaxID=3400919 RepID=UPI003C0C9877
MNKRNFILRAGAAAAIACAMGTGSIASAQSWPNKPVRIVVPFAAGGPADIVAREVAQKLTNQLGQSFVVENAGGGHGIPAMNTVSRGPADGHVLLMAASGNVTIQPITMKASADALATLEPVGQVATSPHVLVVTSKLPVKSVKELVDYAKANPGKVNFGSAGTGGLAHLGMELFKYQGKVDVVHVPYKGTSQVMVDISSGQVQALFSSMPSLKPLVDKGSIRVIGLTAPSDGADTAGVPLISATVPGVEYTTWYAFFAPKGTPAAVANRLNEEMKKVAADPVLRKKLSDQGVDLQASSAAELQALMKRDTDKWAKLIKEAKIEIE